MTGKPSGLCFTTHTHNPREGGRREPTPQSYSTCVLTTSTTHALAFLAVMNSPLGSPAVGFFLKLSSECDGWSLEDKEHHSSSNQGNPSFTKNVSPLTTGLGGMSNWDCANLGSALTHPWGTVALRVLEGEKRRKKGRRKKRRKPSELGMVLTGEGP